MQPIEKLLEVAQSSQSRIGRHFVPGILTPLILICFVACPTCFAAACILREDPVIKYLLVIVGVLPILVACAVYVWFAIRAPQRLQSEDWQLRQEVMQFIYKKGGRVAIEPVSLQAITNAVAQEDEKKREERQP